LESQKFGDADIVQCPQGGKFKISGPAIAVLESVNDPERRRKYLETAKRWVEPEDLPFIRNS
jgi:hypothetical protein